MKWPITTLVLELGFEVAWVSRRYHNGCVVRNPLTRQWYTVSLDGMRPIGAK